VRIENLVFGGRNDAIMLGALIGCYSAAHKIGPSVVGREGEGKGTDGAGEAGGL
jgi:hypothetical protein